MSPPDDPPHEPGDPTSTAARIATLGLELPEHGTGARAARRRAAAGSRLPDPVPPKAAVPHPVRRSGPSQRWMAGFVAVLVVSLVAAAVLAVVGVQTLRESNAGRRVTSADPSEPGFEGLLDPTPTLLVLHEVDGRLISAAVLALGNGDAGGSVILLPPSVKVGDGPEAVPLSVLLAFGGTTQEAHQAAEVITGVGIAEVVVVDDQRWAELVAPVAPLSIDNPDDLEGFPAGPVSLAAEQVGAWMDAAGPDESELGRLYRQQLLWESWLSAIAASDDAAAVPGELDSGLGRFVRGLAAGRLTVTTLPVTEDDGAEVTSYRVDRDALRDVITELIPLPTGTAFAPRTRVRLLDGTGEQEHVRGVAPRVVGADATIVVVGNADSFDYETTEIRYHQPGQRAAAETLQRALGAGKVVEDVRPIDAFDVTIVLGTDT